MITRGLGLLIVSVRVSIAVTSHHGHGNSYKRKHLIGAGLQVRRSLVHHCHGGKPGSVQADMVLEKELRVLHLDGQAPGRETDAGSGLII